MKGVAASTGERDHTPPEGWREREGGTTKEKKVEFRRQACS